jgi:hypothetical protein
VTAVHYVHPDKPHPELWINEIGVAATRRGRGLGTRLLRAVFAEARGLGCAEAWVLTDRANTAAMRLYAAAGSTEAPTDHVMFTFKLDNGTASGHPGVASMIGTEQAAALDGCQQPFISSPRVPAPSAPGPR